MDTVFIHLLNLSISASWLILVVLLLRLALKKVPKSIHCLLWALVGLRLLCPISLESVLSLVPSRETFSQELLYSETPAIHSGIPALNSFVNPALSQSLPPVAEASVNPVQTVVQTACLVWIIGVAALLLYGLFSYLRLRRRLQTAVRLQDRLWQSEAVSSPFVLGLFRPRIYLPFHVDPTAIDHIIAHEEAHLRRRDHWIKPLAFLILSAYWFNPLVWLAYVLLCRDIELACDERVIRTLGGIDKKAYSSTLLRYSVGHPLIAACPLAFGEVGVKARVKNILNYKKPAFWVLVVALAACLIVAVCFLTVPMDRSATLDGREITGGSQQTDIQKTSIPVPLTQDLARIINQYGPGDFTPYDWDPEALPWQIGMASEQFGRPSTEFLLCYDGQQHLLVREGNGATDAAILSQAFSHSEAFKHWLGDLEDYLYQDRAQELYALKTPYIGDPSIVMGILNAFELEDDMNRFTISLKTNERPYGVTLHFGDGYHYNSDSIDQVLTRYGYVFLALVDNAEEFRWEYDAVEPGLAHISRCVSVNDDEGLKLKEYGASPEQFQQLWERLQRTGSPLPSQQDLGAIGISPGAYSPLELAYLPPWSSSSPDFYLERHQHSSFSISEAGFQLKLVDNLSSALPQVESYANPQYVPLPMGDAIEVMSAADENTAPVTLDVSAYPNQSCLQVLASNGTDTGYRIFALGDEIWIGHWDWYGAERTSWWCEYLFRVQPTEDSSIQTDALTLDAVESPSQFAPLPWSSLLPAPFRMWAADGSFTSSPWTTPGS